MSKDCHILSDSNGIWTRNHLFRKRTLNYLAKLANWATIKVSLAKWLSVRLRTKWFWVRIHLLSLKLQIWRLLPARTSLTFRQTIECGFTLKLLRDMIIRYSRLPQLLQLEMALFLTASYHAKIIIFTSFSIFSKQQHYNISYW